MSPTARFKKESVTSVLAIVIAGGSLALNVVQYTGNQDSIKLSQLKDLPTVGTFRIQLSMRTLKKIELLAQKGVRFSHIPNPVIAQPELLKPFEHDTSSSIEFLAVENLGPTPVTNLQLHKTGDAEKPLRFTHLAAQSTLLVPLSIVTTRGGQKQLNAFLNLDYLALVGPKTFAQSKSISPPGERTIVYEIGLGAIAKAVPDFEYNK